MANTVAVFGGGIGGLTAAHELAERGFDVTVYEAEDRLGGKARSVPISDSQPERNVLHGEHGFRFFPAYYRHVIDTMARIPDGDGTVENNLVPTQETLIASIHGNEQTSDLQSPQSPQEWIRALRPSFADDLSATETRFLLERFLYVLTSCDRRRERELDTISWWEFVDAENRSPEFQQRIGAITQALVALRPEQASTRTMATIYLQLLFGQYDPTVPTERILNGPTNIAWIDPWTDYLKSIGVTFQTGTTLTELGCDDRTITHGVLETDTATQTITAEYYVLALPVDIVPQVLTPSLKQLDPALGRIEQLDTAWMNGVQYYLTEDIRLARGHSIYTDSPWALTAISQRQFWTHPAIEFDRRRDEGIEGVLSVIASDWNTDGVLYGKPARECTPNEIKEEIWAQLKQHLNQNRTKRLSDEMIVDWFLDPAITEVEDGTGVQNQSPLLINTVGSLWNRPRADSQIPNLALAGDYVRTNSDLASMESANEGGRRAANAVLRHSDSRTSYCRVWELEEPAIFAPFKAQDAVRYRLGRPHAGDVLRKLTSSRSRPPRIRLTRLLSER